MKRSDLTVSMPMTSFDELEEYKKKYMELRDKVCDCLKPSTYEGIDYEFNVRQALDLVKETTRAKTTSNIEVVYDKKIGGK